MIPFMPETINGSTCAGIEAYEAGRPPRTPAYVGITWFFLGLSAVLWSVALVGFYLLQNHMRFRVVRPFKLQLALCLGQILFNVTLMLHLAIDTLPCWVLLVGMTWGFASFGGNYFTRLLTYVVESQFALVMAERNKQAKDRFVNNDDAQSTGTGAQTRTGKMSLISTASLLTSLVSLSSFALGFTTLDDMTFGELYTQSHSLWLVSRMSYFPVTVAWIVLIIVVPQYVQCSNCSITLDLWITFMVVLVLYCLLSARMLYVAAFKLKFPSDPYGAFREFVQVLVFVGPTMFLACLLLLIDPNQVQYDRGFAFEWLLVFSTLMYWWISAGNQFLQVFLQRRRSRSSASSSINGGGYHGFDGDDDDGTNHLPDYLAVINATEEIKAAFERFAIARYAAENLYFVNDVSAFKKFFYEKAPNWRKQKAAFLFDTYLKPDAVMEVNISQHMKLKAISEVEESLRTTGGDMAQLYMAFDSALEDITVNVLRDIFSEFRKENKTMIMNALKSNSNLGSGPANTEMKRAATSNQSRAGRLSSAVAVMVTDV